MNQIYQSNNLTSNNNLSRIPTARAFIYTTTPKSTLNLQATAKKEKNVNNEQKSLLSLQNTPLKAINLSVQLSNRRRSKKFEEIDILQRAKSDITNESLKLLPRSISQTFGNKIVEEEQFNCALTQNSSLASYEDKINIESDINCDTSNNIIKRQNSKTSFKFNQQNSIKNDYKCYDTMNTSWQSTVSSIGTQTSEVNIYRRASLLEEYACQQLNKINASDKNFTNSIITTGSTACLKLCSLRAKVILNRSCSCLIMALDKARPRCRWWRKLRHAKCWRRFSKNKIDNLSSSNLNTPKKLLCVNNEKVLF